MFQNSMIKIDNFFVQYKNFIILFFILGLYVPFVNLPPYYDDEIRFTSNMIGLFEQGRIIPDLWFRFITSSKVADVYILNLIFCGLFSLILLKIKYFKDNYFLFVVVFSNSFLIENISYHVDGLGMIISFNLAIFAAFYEHENKNIMFLVSIILALISILCYQSSLNIFSTCVLVVFVLDCLHKNNNNFMYLKIRLLVFLCMLILIKATLFFVSLVQEYFYLDPARLKYIERRSNIDFFAFPNQFLEFMNLFFSSFNSTQFFLLFICLILILFKLKYLAYSLFSLILCFFLIFFPYVFVDSYWLVQPRLLFGFSGFLLLIYVWIYYSTEQKKIKTLVNLVFSIYALIFLFSVSAYVNSYKLAIELEANTYKKIEMLINPINPVNFQRCGYNTMIFDAKYIKVQANSYPIIYHIIRTPKTHLLERSQGVYDLYNLNFIAEYCIFDDNQTMNELLLNDKYFKLYKIGDNSYRMIYK